MRFLFKQNQCKLIFAATLVLISYAGCEKDVPTGNSTPNNDLRLGNQAQIDALANNTDSIIKGSVYIGGDDIVNLLGLHNIKKIQGVLRIWDCKKLVDLNGLENLSQIARLDLYNNDKLRNANALANCNITEKIDLSYNYALEQLPVLKNTTSIAEGVMVYECPKLKDLTFLSNVTSLGSLYINTNVHFKDLHGLENLKVVNGNVNLLDLDSLASIDALTKLESVSGYLKIWIIPQLTNLSGLKNLKTVQADFELNYLEKVIDLNPLINLRFCKTLNINSVNSIQSLAGIDSLTVDETIYVNDNTALTDFCPLKKVFNRNNGHKFVCSGNAVNPSVQDILNCP